MKTKTISIILFTTTFLITVTYSLISFNRVNDSPKLSINSVSDVSTLDERLPAISTSGISFLNQQH